MYATCVKSHQQRKEWKPSLLIEGELWVWEGAIFFTGYCFKMHPQPEQKKDIDWRRWCARGHDQLWPQISRSFSLTLVVSLVLKPSLHVWFWTGRILAHGLFFFVVKYSALSTPLYLQSVQHSFVLKIRCYFLFNLGHLGLRNKSQSVSIRSCFNSLYNTSDRNLMWDREGKVHFRYIPKWFYLNLK